MKIMFTMWSMISLAGTTYTILIRRIDSIESASFLVKVWKIIKMVEVVGR